MDRKSEAGTTSIGPGTLMTLLMGSGAAALASEVVWTRILEDVFGSTAGAVAVVLASFMAGMGLGGFFFGRRADRAERPLKLYGLLEICAGVAAALVPPVVWLCGHAYGLLYRTAGPESSWVLTAAWVVLSLVVLFVPAFALGGTLPVLVRYAAARPGGLGYHIGRLYAANTAGAVIGCFAAGYLLIPALGILGSAYLAAGLRLTVGLVSLVLDQKNHGSHSHCLATDLQPPFPNHQPPTTNYQPPPWAIPVLYGLSGFAALGCEVLWTRALVFLLRSTVYAFTAMLTVYLLGLAIGGAIGARLARRTRRALAWFVAIELAVGLTVAASLWVLRTYAGHWGEVDLALSAGWGRATLLHLGISASVMLAPTVLLGALFPLAGRLQEPLAPAGSATGALVLGNTLGAAAGSLVAAFVLLPLVGTARALLLLACVNLVVAAGAIALLTEVRSRWKVRLMVGAVACSVAVFALVPPATLRGLLAAPMPGTKLVYAQENPNGIVTVHQYPDSGYRVLSVGGVTVAGTAPPLRATQVLQGLIPLVMFDIGPRDPISGVYEKRPQILQVGLGSGETARVVLGFEGIERLTCVEICPAVVAAAGELFGDVNAGVLDDERFRLVLADGKSFVRHTRGSYDVILSESTYPFLRGSSGLYTLEYLQDCRARLKPGGLMSVWLPLDVPEAGLRALLNTFVRVFPHASLWTTNAYGYKHALVLGSLAPPRVHYNLQTLVKRPSVARDFKAAGIVHPLDLVLARLLDADAIRDYSAGAKLHTRNRPVIEYETALRSSRHWRERLARNLDALGRYPMDPFTILRGSPENDWRPPRTFVSERQSKSRAVLRATIERLHAQARAFPHLVSARRAARERRKTEAVAAYQRALGLDPADAQARNELGMLYLELGRLKEARELQRDAPGSATPRR